MAHPRPFLGNSSDPRLDEPGPPKSGTRRASRTSVDAFESERPERDSERPTLRIRRTLEPAGCLDATPRLSDAVVHSPPREATFSEFAALPVVENRAFEDRPAPRPCLPPIALDPEPSAGDRTRSPRSRARSRRYVAAAAVVMGFLAIVILIARSGPPADPAFVSAPVVNQAPPGGPAAPLDPPIEPLLDVPTAALPPPPVTASDVDAKPASVRAPGSAPARTQRIARPPSKRSNDVDFGI